MPARPQVTISAGDIDVAISNSDKVLFPEVGVTKLDLAEYYLKVAPYMLPHVAGRPLTMVRFPEGAGGDEFYQKEAQSFFPDYISRVEVEIEDGMRQYIAADNAATLVYLANLVTVPHIWITRRPDFRCADIVVWDLDPAGTVDFPQIRTGAKLLRHLLTELDIHAYLKVTGSRGIHVSAVLDAPRPVGEVFEFSREVSQFIARTLPRAFTTEFSKDRRGNRIYLDYLRNRYAQSFVAPFAVRPLPTAPLAAPIDWPDLETDLTPQDVTVKGIDSYLSERMPLLDDWQHITFDFAASNQRLQTLLERG